MRIITEFTEQRIVQVHQLYQDAWWAKGRSLSDTELCVRGSQLCFGLVDQEDQLVGFTRVLSDFIFKALIFDVIISPTLQGQGRGTYLMNAVLNHDKLKNVQHIELYCLPELQEYYQRLGFSSEVGGINLMRRVSK